MLRTLYKDVIASHQDAPTFIVLLSFLITFLTARIVIYLIDAQVFPDFYLRIGQSHIHHLNYGIFLLSVSGYLALVFNSKRVSNWLAIAYGIGLALTFDEFALFLHLQNNYYARISYEAIIVITVLLINIVYFSSLWRRIFWFILRRSNQ